MPRGIHLHRSLTFFLTSLVALLAAHWVQATEWAWTPSMTDLEKLERGEVLLFTEADRELEKGDVRAAVRVNASAEHVFQIMTSCAHAMKFVPRLKHCKVLETAPDGSWQTVEHEVDGDGYLPRTRYVFRAEYERFARIRCTEVSGDFRENRGLWTFRPVAGAAATLVTYTVHVVPRFYAPRWVVRSSLKRELPVLMAAFRDVAQSAEPAAGHHVASSAFQLASAPAW